MGQLKGCQILDSSFPLGLTSLPKREMIKITSVLSLKFAALVHFIPSKNLPFPSLSKRGENCMETIPPLKKGDTGGFAFDFICRER